MSENLLWLAIIAVTTFLGLMVAIGMMIGDRKERP